jgi:succinate-semialdehyde dehydrogenase/glutarate-semialdehyde dehydrogenase
VIAKVAVGSVADVDRAVTAAAKAVTAWATASAFERAGACEAIARAIVDQREALAWALSEDQGKPLVAEAYDEVDELAEQFRQAAADATRLVGVLPPSRDPARRVLVQRVPIGVVGVVSPWNWPYAMAGELLAPAIAAGNTTVWVPAPTSSACSAVLGGLVGEALPPGVLNLVTGPGPVVGDALVAHPGVAGVGFVGSVATGRGVATRAAGKRQVLELGGNGPFIVLEDAQLDLVVPAVLEAAYLCAGQSCTAGELFVVHRSRRNELVEAVAAATDARVRLGDPFEATTTMGPMNNDAVVAKVAAQVDEAVARGARLVRGGGRRAAAPTPLYYEATILDGVTSAMVIAREETFGPVVPVMEVASDEEALEVTCRSGFGLTVAVFSGDLDRALRFAEAVPAGWVNVNATTNLWEAHLPFGGRAGTTSGIGRVGGASVLEAFSEPKTVTFPLGRQGR